MAEPTGHTLDGTPWQEARPPHLPDRLTAISPWTGPFLLVAAWQLWTVWSQRPQTEPMPAEWWGQLLGIVPSISTALIGAAVFLRHPDAWRSLRLVALGASLLLVAMAWEHGRQAFGSALEGFLGATAFFEPAMTLMTLYGLIGFAVKVVGLIAIGVGLDRARRAPGGSGGRALLVAVPALGATLTIGTWIALGDVVAFRDPGTLLLVAGQLGLGVAVDAALAYLLVVGLRGLRETGGGRRGWLALVIGVALMLVASTVLPPLAAWWFAATQDTGLLPLLSVASITGSLLLLAAFAAGLPPTDGADPTLDPPAATTPGSAAG